MTRSIVPTNPPFVSNLHCDKCGAPLRLTEMQTTTYANGSVELEVAAVCTNDITHTLTQETHHR